MEKTYETKSLNKKYRNTMVLFVKEYLETDLRINSNEIILINKDGAVLEDGDATEGYKYKADSKYIIRMGFINLQFKVINELFAGFNWNFYSDNSIKEVLNKIYEQYGIPCDQQIISVDGNAKVMPLHDTLADNGIHDNSEILVNAKDFVMNLKFSDGKTCSLLVNALMTYDILVQRIKEMIPEYNGKSIIIKSGYYGETLGRMNINDKDLYDAFIYNPTPARITVHGEFSSYEKEYQVDLSERIGRLAEVFYKDYPSGENPNIKLKMFPLNKSLSLLYYGVKDGDTCILSTIHRGC